MECLHHETFLPWQRTYRGGGLNLIPIHIDSPLASRATEVSRRYTECYDEEISRTFTFVHGEEKQALSLTVAIQAEHPKIEVTVPHIGSNYEV